MASVDLVYRVGPLGEPADLVFGEAEAQEVLKTLSIGATLPALSLAVTIQRGAVNVTLGATLPALSLAVTGDYSFFIPNYAINSDGLPWGQAAGLSGAPQAGPWRQATPGLESIVASDWHDAVDAQNRAEADWHSATPIFPHGSDAPWHSATPIFPHGSDAPWREAAHVGALVDRLPWKQANLLLRSNTSKWRDAKLNQGRVSFPWRDGVGLLAFGAPLDPRDGADHRCYIPGSPADLVFAEMAATDANLFFYCELHPPVPPTTGETVVVPIRKVYLVLNTVNLVRTSDGRVLPTLSLSLSIDASSWTWGFSATLPGSELQYLVPDTDGTPVELAATINGTTYRVLAESLGTDRTFGRKDLKVSGRGKNAMLDAPYAPNLSFGNAGADRTAAQLLDDALMLNGVSIGWTVDFGLTDWLVPAGAWAHQGTHMTAVNTIAAAAGGYVQPHPTDDTLRILARYPVLPWNWSTDVTPDFELPAAVTEREAIEWIEKVRYNRVFVSGTGQGILGQVTRTGSDGSIVAPMVTDALITEAAAASQRGGSILGDTGRIANVTLRLPVLAETGIIEPGKFVKYTDAGGDRLGIVRSTQVDVNSQADVWQSLVVETHE